MAKILYTTSNKAENHNDPFYNRFTTLLNNDRFKIHSATDSPAEADVILFVDSTKEYLKDIREHKFRKEFGDKTFVMISSDKFITYIPGLYTSIEKKWYDRNWIRSFHYIGVTENPPMVYNPDHSVRNYLFSFLGSFYTSKIRKKIGQIKYDSAVIEDVKNLKVKRSEGKKVTSEDFDEYKKRYSNIIAESHFILCPRGLGTSSYRLFESMMMGRCPVIISDQWVEPEGPDWSEFSIRIKEKDYKKIPDILNERKSESGELGKKARQAWVEWFSDETSFHRIVEWLLDIKNAGKTYDNMMRLKMNMQILRPYHTVRYLKKKILK